MRRANSLPKFRWPIIACRKHRFHPLKSGFLKSTGQRVDESTSWWGRRFEDSKFRVFEDSIFSMGVGEGVKKKWEGSGVGRFLPTWGFI